MKILSNLEHKTSHSTLHVFSDFPAVPKAGMMVLKDDGILYIYSSIDAVPTWRPLNIKSKSFVHTQAAASTTWTIEHNLGSQNLIYFIYDINNDRQNEMDVAFTDTTMTLTFLESIKGKCVVFAEGDNFSGVSGPGATPTATGNLSAYRFRVKNWTTLANGQVAASNLEFETNTATWTITKEGDTQALITHGMGKRPCGHDVMKGPDIDNKSYPTSTLRLIEYITDNSIRMYGYLNMDDLYITIFFIG